MTLLSRLTASLGAAALAGTGFPIDRDMTAEALGFARPMANSLDAVSARDFALGVGNGYCDASQGGLSRARRVLRAPGLGKCFEPAYHALRRPAELRFGLASHVDRSWRWSGWPSRGVHAGRCQQLARRARRRGARRAASPRCCRRTPWASCSTSCRSPTTSLQWRRRATRSTTLRSSQLKPGRSLARS